ARTAFLAAHAHDLDAAYRGLEDAQLSLLVATGQLSEAQGKLASIEDKRDRAILDFAASQEKEVTAANAILDTMRTRQQYLEMLPGALSTAIDYWGGFTSAQVEATHTLEALSAAELANTDTQHDTAKALAATAAAEAKAKAAREASTVAAARAKTETEAYTKALEDNAAAYAKWLGEFDKDKADKAGMVAAKNAQGVLEKKRDAMSEEAAFEANKFEQEKAHIQWLQDYAEGRERDRLQAQADVQSGVTAAGSASGILGAIAKTSPEAGIVIGIMEAVGNLDSTLSGLDSFVDDFRNGLKTGGKAIVEFLVEQIKDVDLLVDAAIGFVQGFVAGIPDIIAALVGEIAPLAVALVQGLVEGAPQIVASLIVALTDPETWIAVGESIAKGIGDALTNPYDRPAPGTAPGTGPGEGNVWATDAPAIGTAMTGSHADGADYIDKTGLYMVHRGERIDTASRTQRESTSAMGGGGSARMVGRGGKVYIEIDADSLSDTFDGLRGRGYSMGAR
ncbi:hypothetical protein, partial [Gemmatimonas sp.]|uniref:hypothetical protein n=1 Tax=Gemmatimonas sp. TaxID=1962908 RepID=UPI0027BADE17